MYSREQGTSSLKFKSPASTALILKLNVFFLTAAFFIRPFYKMMLQKPITLDDMQSVVS